MLEYVALKGGEKIPVRLFIDLWLTGNMKALSGKPLVAVSKQHPPSWDYEGAVSIMRLMRCQR